MLAGTTYSFRVKAANELGKSPYSQIKSAKTYALPTPAGLAAAAVSSRSVKLTWIDTSSNEMGFKIQRRKSTSTRWATIRTVAANTTSFNDTGVTANTSYQYRIRAFNSRGYSAYTDQVAVTTLGATGR